MDLCYATRDFTCDECFTTMRALVVEEDAITRKHVVRFAVIHHDPVAIQLGAAVRGTWIEGRGFRLQDLLHLAVQLACGCLFLCIYKVCIFFR